MKVSFVSLGCSKNQVDSEQMLAKLAGAGMEIVSRPEESQVVVINTCGFIRAAVEEAIEEILKAASLKGEGTVDGIVVTGCLAQRYLEEIGRELPEVNCVLGTGSAGRIVEAIEKAARGESFFSFDPPSSSNLGGERMLIDPPYSAYLKIAEGCDNRCAYCIIPTLRGRYRSREMRELLAEARSLSARGVRELIVVAQDITRYGTDLAGKRLLPELLKELCQLDFRWIRLHYLYPDEIDDELIDTIAKEDKIVKYLDIPLQHVNDALLRRMNRRGDAASIRQLIERLRSRIPELVLRTSFIVGLPGEGEAEFAELTAFLKETRLERAGIFAFSKENGTLAYDMDDQVDEDIKARRQFLLEEVASRAMDGYHNCEISKEREVLCEGFDEESGLFVGRTYADSPGIDGRVLFSSTKSPEPGSFVHVRIECIQDADRIGAEI